MRPGLHSQYAPNPAGRSGPLQFIRFRRIKRRHRLPRILAIAWIPICKIVKGIRNAIDSPGISKLNWEDSVGEVINDSNGPERRSSDSANLEQRAEIDVSEKIFANGPNMLVLCLTVIGLIKIYTRFEKITTLADNFLAFISLGYLAATVVAYMALRTRDRKSRLKLSRFADLTFLISLGLTAAVALFMTFALEG